jgi:hypothetical protein
VLLLLLFKKVGAALTEAVIIGANCAPSEFESTINLLSLLHEIAVCAP